MVRLILLGSFIAFGILCSCLAVAETTQPTSNLPLMPYPQQLVVEPDAWLAVTGNIAIQLPTQDRVITNAVERFIQRLHQQTDVHLAVNEQAQVAFIVTLEDTDTSTALQLHQDESYQLQITAQSILLSAPHYTGMLHGLETLLQLASVQSTTVIFPIGTISDFPRFTWRGLLLDSARHFLPVDTMKRHIDGMAALKLNVLHWHLTDDQGWRLESKRFPRLHEVGGQDGYYSHHDVNTIVRYAQERGIRVVPEIDLPGHTTALGAAYPEYMAMPGPDVPEMHWGVHPAVLDPSNEDVYVFIKQLLEEVTDLFPDSYLHIGGDEVLPDHWHANSSIQQFMQQHQLHDHIALHDYFNQRLLAIISEFDRNMIGWDEVLTPTLDKSVMVQSWRGMDSMVQAAQQGHDTILSTGFYLDQPQTAAYHYRVDPQPAPSPAITSDYLAWSSWDLAAERKRGAPISAQLYLLYLPDHTVEGYIDFAGRSRQRLHDLQLEANRLRFQVDTWMGPITATLMLDKQLSGQLVVGNAPYAVSGKQLTYYQHDKTLPVGIKRPALTNSQQRHILGGEIALWGELVTQDVIDRRLWPQAAVVAERLWSSASLSDEKSLYQRLESIDDWLARSVHLKHQEQQLNGLLSLVNTDGLVALQQLAIALEPAHYYHRLHEKSVRDDYSKLSPLNRLVDFLPAENFTFRRLHQLTSDWLNAPKSVDIEPLKVQLVQWQHMPSRLPPQLKNSAAAAELIPVIELVSQLASMALRLIDHTQPLTLSERQQLKTQLQASQGIHSEMVIALERLVSTLLETTPLSRIWLPAGFTAGIEGPAIDTDGYLYAVNYQHEGTIGRVSLAGQAELFLTLPTGHIGNGIQFNSAGQMMIADYTGHSILRYDPITSTLTTYAQNSSMNQPNDLTIAKSGTIYASDPNWSKQDGQLWRIDTDGSSHLVAASIGTSNGIEIMPDQHNLWVNESIQRRLWRYPIKADKSLGKRQLLAAFSDAGLDGMRVNSHGQVAVTRYGKGTVILLDQQGRLLEELPLQHRTPTNVAFNAAGHLYVTLQDCGCIEYIKLPAPFDEDRPQ